ncbi:ankyrin repeat domain-containing protein [Chromobacterium phragmitis]|uniref:Uncharacterized protein n=1 Tax=Chromobacterium phragmitis TaxID=2202141 RepID=A0A344UMC7_9NEIS|nr:ankyrin repeat domain-containing protein [Chromobacterium phragmitis]AXE36425.1 hypothetical protein DK843_20265 [Chromobacterium phragmitis]
MLKKNRLLLTAATMLAFSISVHAKSLEDKLLEATASYIDKPSVKKMQTIDALLAQGAKPHFEFPMDEEDTLEIPTPLGLSIYFNDAALTHKFLEAKPDLSLPTSTLMNMPPMMYAMLPPEMNAKETAARRAIIKDLLAHGASPNVKTADTSTTPLMVASGVVEIYPPDLENAKTLLQAGADPNARDQFGNGAFTSMGASHLGILKLMLEAKADAKKPNENGQNAMHYVCTRYFKTRANAPDPEAEERIALLKQAGLDINGLPERQGMGMLGNPLHSALQQKNPDCVRALLKQGASLDAPAVLDLNGNTPTLREWLKTDGKDFLKDNAVPASLRKQLL